MARLISQATLAHSHSRILKSHSISFLLLRSTLHSLSSPSKMNTSAFSEPLDSSRNNPTSQQTVESRALSRQGRKEIIPKGLILKHLGLDKAKSSSNIGNKLVENRQNGASDKDMASSELSLDCSARPELISHDKSQQCTSRRENVNSLNRIGLSSDVDPDCGLESPSTLVSDASGTNVKKTTVKTSIKEEEKQCFLGIIVNQDLSEDKGCSLQNVVDNTYNCSASSSFRNCRKAQTKRSKLKDANSNSPDDVFWRIKCNESNKEFSNSSIQPIENNFSRDCEMLDHTAGHMDLQNDHSFPASFGKKKAPYNSKLKHGLASKQKQNHYHKSPPLSPFDICDSECELRTCTEVVFAKDDQETSEMCESNDVDNSRVLRPGMVLLKGYLTLDEQASIVSECRNLGLGPGGFYQPGYKYGAKLRLMMMCLGLDWDPQTRRYSNNRRFDNSQPPNIPCQFSEMVRRAMVDSQALTEKEYEQNNVAEILPMMLPNICIVNFYNTAGRLGLHQDRDESRESLSKGLPVVSISIGDSAEFLYGDERDISKAEKLVLESGDVLIFGGESRHIFHGVESIIPGSAPESLLEKTHLLPGRLNLTFRQF